MKQTLFSFCLRDARDLLKNNKEGSLTDSEDNSQWKLIYCEDEFS